ncbi:hypothetical protein [Cellulomonas sp. P5_C5]
MSALPVLDVKPTSEARIELSATLERFRREGIAAEPLVFGSHRRAEGVVIPYELFRDVYDAIEDARLAAVLRDRIADGTPRISLEDVVNELGVDRATVDLD